MRVLNEEVEKIGDTGKTADLLKRIYAYMIVQITS
jgi:hypothetical protein